MVPFRYVYREDCLILITRLIPGLKACDIPSVSGSVDVWGEFLYWRRVEFPVEWIVTADANLESGLPDSGDLDKTFILFNLTRSCTHS